MIKRKRILKKKRIILPDYTADCSPIDMEKYYDYYDKLYQREDMPDYDEDDIDANLEYYEKIGVITYPKVTAVIDGEAEVMGAFMSGYGDSVGF